MWRGTLRERFNEKYIPVTESGCWIWTGASSARYGTIYDHSKRKVIKAHHAAFLLFNGPIPNGMCVCHVCDVTFCVNPDHLFIGTQKDNIHDMIKKGRKVISPNAGRHGNHARGERNGSSKYPPVLISSIRHIYDSGECKNIAAISRKFGVSESQTRRIVHRQSWT